LGDTLFPVTTLSQGLRQDFSPTAHFLIQLRLYHPLIAVVVGAYLLLMAGLCNIKQPRPAGRGLAGVLLGIYLTQLAVGVINVLLLAPIWMQLLHLFLSDLILITLVLFMATVFARPQAQESDPVGPIVQPGQQLYG
jgi:heme A synthase